MDLDFSKDQRLIQTSVEEFLEIECPPDKVRELEQDEKGYDPELWRKIAKLGWMGIIFPEEYNGTEGDLVDLMIVIEEMGKKLLPSPFFTTVVLCSLPLLAYGKRKQKEDYLPRIADGEKIWTLAITESSASYCASELNLNFVLKGGEYVLSGEKIFVPYAHVADYLLVVAKNEDGFTLFIVDTKTQGIKIEVIPTTAHDKQCEVTFDNVKVPGSNILGEESKGWDIVNFILQRGTLLKCAEMIGGAQTALEITKNYAKKRIQFDRPIGSFQAIQHKLADLYINVEGLRYLVYEAGWGISIGSHSDLLISMAKAKANEVYQRTCIECIRIHGAIGFTREQDISLYHLRTKAMENALGNSYFHLEKISAELEHYQSRNLQSKNK